MAPVLQASQLTRALQPIFAQVSADCCHLFVSICLSGSFFCVFPIPAPPPDTASSVNRRSDTASVLNTALAVGAWHWLRSRAVCLHSHLLASAPGHAPSGSCLVFRCCFSFRVYMTRPRTAWLASLDRAQAISCCPRNRPQIRRRRELRPPWPCYFSL